MKNRSSNRSWLEVRDRFIPAHWQPAILFELLLEYEPNSHKLLNGTGIFYEDFLNPELVVSPQQFSKLISNCRKHYRGSDLAYRYGQRLFPGNYSDFSYYLTSASSLQEALQALEWFSVALSPLLTPKIFLSKDFCSINWYSAFGVTDNEEFIYLSTLTATRELFRSLSGVNYPWLFEFEFSKPTYVEQLEVNLGEHLIFSQPATRMVLHNDYLHQPWPNASPITYQRGLQKYKDSTLALKHGLIFLIRSVLIENIQNSVDQDWLASTLNISTATLKRKLKFHNISFRQILDDCRMEVALHLYRDKGFTNEQVADYLGFYDEANLRRSFKRWTGKSPSAFLANFV